MTVKVRSGHLEGDRQSVVALLARELNPAYDRRRFEWLYQANPAGNGRLWMAIEGDTGDVIGTAGAIPRHMNVNGRRVRAWVLADFCLDKRHRTLGPAVMLQRACLEDLAAEGMPFCYDFPSRAMEAVYRRLGIRTSIGRMVRLARPLRMAKGAATRWRDSLPGRVVAAATDYVLARAAQRIVPSGLTLVPQEATFDQEFSVLAWLGSAQAAVCGERSCEYMNWRYRENPLRRHEMLCVRRDGALAGYAILARDGDAGAVVDLFGVEDVTVIRALLQGAMAHFWRGGLTSMSVSLLDGHPWIEVAQSLGFRAREVASVVSWVPAGSACVDAGLTESRWFLTSGDREA